MTKRTRKAGITGKYGTRYDSAIKKIVKKFEWQQHAKYICPPCGKVVFLLFKQALKEYHVEFGNAKDVKLLLQEVHFNLPQVLQQQLKLQWTA